MKKQKLIAGVLVPLLLGGYLASAQQMEQSQKKDIIQQDKFPIDPNLKPVNTDELAMPAFSIYPNPCQDVLTVRPANELPGELLIFSMTGSQVLKQTITGETDLAVSSLPPGVYLIRLNRSTYRFTKE